jgi:hypothetical protein
MKTFLHTLAAILLLCFTFAGCKKDSDKSNNEVTTKNSVKVDGVEYDLSQGYLEYYGGDGSGYKFQLYLASHGISINGHESVLDSASGIGHIINFQIYSSRSDELAPGNYTYSTSGLAGTYKLAGLALNCDASQLIAFLTITSSGIKVVKNGSEYELSFTGTDLYNKPISCYYKGSLKYYDHTLIKNNYLKVGGTEYDISKGLLINLGGSKSVYNLELDLISSGITVHEHMGFPDSVSGVGHLIYFNMFSTSADNLPIGEYVLNNTEQAGSFSYADYITNWNTDLQNDPDFIALVSGTVNIIKYGTEYELSFSGIDSNSKTITGYYKGSLKYYDEGKDKKPGEFKGVWN